jgi:hypothetical protein
MELWPATSIETLLKPARRGVKPPKYIFLKGKTPRSSEHHRETEMPVFAGNQLKLVFPGNRFGQAIIDFIAPRHGAECRHAARNFPGQLGRAAGRPLARRIRSTWM